MFRVGDLIESLPGNPGGYSMTIPGVTLKVTGIRHGSRYDDSDIFVLIVDGDGPSYPVESRHFRRVGSTPHTLDTWQWLDGSTQKMNEMSIQDLQDARAMIRRGVSTYRDQVNKVVTLERLLKEKANV